MWDWEEENRVYTLTQLIKYITGKPPIKTKSGYYICSHCGCPVVDDICYECGWPQKFNNGKK